VQIGDFSSVPTVPSTLSTELETNPFFAPSDPGIRAQLGMGHTPPGHRCVAEIRARKDRVSDRRNQWLKNRRSIM